MPRFENPNSVAHLPRMIPTTTGIYYDYDELFYFPNQPQTDKLMISFRFEQNDPYRSNHLFIYDRRTVPGEGYARVDSVGEK